MTGLLDEIANTLMPTQGASHLEESKPLWYFQKTARETHADFLPPCYVCTRYLGCSSCSTYYCNDSARILVLTLSIFGICVSCSMHYPCLATELVNPCVLQFT